MRTANAYIYTFFKILVNLTKNKLNILLRNPQGDLFDSYYWNIMAVRCRSPSEQTSTEAVQSSRFARTYSN